uniref:Uncharacterized protein n=1 Tax=Setaria italica TaxID=4555 RepID=K3YFA4_SETIT
MSYPSYDQEDLQDPNYDEEDLNSYGQGSEPNYDFDNDGWED